jgi:ABC-type antimicrobial peptide transport system permease subunit
LNRKKFTGYLLSAFHNILKNKPYALFCIIGTTLTFTFVVLVLQLIYIFTSDYPPMNNAGRIVRLNNFYTTEGSWLGGIPHQETNAFFEELKDFDCISLYHNNLINIEINGHLFPWTAAAFVHPDFWEMYPFHFLYGRPFSKEDCIHRKPLIVIMENAALSFFGTKNVVGKKVSFQQREYEISGVVKNISFFSTPTDMATVWVPYFFDTFLPNATYSFMIDILIPPSITIHEGKAKISHAVRNYYRNQNIQVDISPQKLPSLKEAALENQDGDLFKYGGFAALFLLLIVPALNMLLLSTANTNNRAEEIAIRKTFGASTISAFLQIMLENLLLVITGALLGLALAVPVIHFMQSYFMEFGFLSIIGHIDYWIILLAGLPAIIIFSLLSGGLPAYLIARRNVAQVLKGGSK